MTRTVTRDVEYSHDGTRMLGYLCAPAGAQRFPGVLLIHDAFGLGEDAVAAAHRLADLGLAVFAADVWGDRATPATEPEIGPLIGGMVADRDRWTGRVAAAHEAAAAQPEVDGSALVVMGFCFGGSSALEHLRTGGDVRGVVSVHGGLDLLHDDDWSRATTTAPVLLCTGADDPMATASMRARLQGSLSAAGIDWEEDLYSGTKHAFTSPRARFSPRPEAIAYNPRSAARAWEATTRFLHELFPDRLGPRPGGPVLLPDPLDDEVPA
ncbi:dienelactone hydrolase family protein [Kineococcus arenarius]|uniref:dienelactone hydrolase family protein n=1 Tax=unclassified Kineococcus TaxID=2621656 RepID=UPI003D7EA5F4